ncbi:MAG: DUF86 domain-containing protein [Pseudonocardiales bacterium]|nr:DUF86 domain-containing protein [Pseudonocardiales bacterium]
MPDRLIHHYFGINLDVLWQTVTTDLPQLLAALPRIDNVDPNLGHGVVSHGVGPARGMRTVLIGDCRFGKTENQARVSVVTCLTVDSHYPR